MHDIMQDISTSTARPSSICSPWCTLPRGHHIGPDAVDRANGTWLLIHRAPVLADAGGGRLAVLAVGGR